MNFKPYIQCETDLNNGKEQIKRGKETLRSGGGGGKAAASIHFN